MPFLNRTDAGRRLAARLEPLRGQDIIVLGLPRGGVSVAYEVALALDAPLDVIVVRKLGVPYQPELAMGAIGEGGVRVINAEILRAAGVPDRELAIVEERERAELERRGQRFRGDREPVSLSGRVAVVVDDGIATGSTASAACRVARAQGAARVLLAVPVAPPSSVDALRADADEVISLETPESLYAIGEWYADFSQASDAEIVELLDRAAKRPTASHAPAGDPAADDAFAGDARATDEAVEVLAGSVALGGQLTVPAGASGLVVFAHGSGSSRHSRRNRFVAGVLNDAGFATLLFDLLTAGEEDDRANVFDIPLLAGRLVAATRWLRQRSGPESGWIGYFGASTGAAAALWAAADPGSDVGAIVSRGGRPDLAAERLPAVTAPTLLIVGGDDRQVLTLNQQAQAQLRCENRIAVVPGATHLFEEPGALQAVAELARDWFIGHRAPVPERGR